MADVIATDNDPVVVEEEESDGWGDYDEACAVRGGCQFPDGK